jgi:hypothetical protein
MNKCSECNSTRFIPRTDPTKGLKCVSCSRAVKGDKFTNIILDSPSLKCTCKIPMIGHIEPDGYIDDFRHWRACLKCKLYVEDSCNFYKRKSAQGRRKSVSFDGKPAVHSRKKADLDKPEEKDPVVDLPLLEEDFASLHTKAAYARITKRLTIDEPKASTSRSSSITPTHARRASTVKISGSGKSTVASAPRSRPKPKFTVPKRVRFADYNRMRVFDDDGEDRKNSWISYCGQNDKCMSKGSVIKQNGKFVCSHCKRLYAFDELE